MKIETAPILTLNKFRSLPSKSYTLSIDEEILKCQKAGIKLPLALLKNVKENKFSKQKGIQKASNIEA